MPLRTSKINFRRNWVCNPNTWSIFLSNLQADMEDLMTDMENVDFNFDTVNTYVNEIIEEVGKNGS